MKLAKMIGGALVCAFVVYQVKIRTKGLLDAE